MKMSKAAVDSMIRNDVFNQLNIATLDGFHKINDRQYGVLVTDAEGHTRYARIGVIVAEEREDVSAEDLMQAEISAYEEKQAEKAKKAAEKAEKIAADQKKREEKMKEKEG